MERGRIGERPLPDGPAPTDSSRQEVCPVPFRRLLALSALVVVPLGLLASGCDSEDVTGAPKDIGDLVHVIPAKSHCDHDPGNDTVHFYVGLRNTGGDDRTVHITPVRRFSDGPDVGTSIDEFPVTVAGNTDAEGDLEVTGVSDNLAGCSVRIDSGDPIKIALQTTP